LLKKQGFKMAATDTYYPSFDLFKKLSEKGNLIPVYREIFADMETPVSAFKKLNTVDHCFLLESVEGGEKWARYSFLGFNPSIIFKSKGSRVEVVADGKTTVTMTADPLSLLKVLMKQYRPVEVQGLPRFFGGAVGYISYDMVRFFEKLPAASEDDCNWYDAYLMITDTLLIFDNLKHTLAIVYNAHVHEGADLKRIYAAALKRINTIISYLGKPLKKEKPEKKIITGAVTSNYKKNDFEKIVRQAKEYIRAGDIIQTVLSQRFETTLCARPFDLYRSLRVINPSPYMYYLKLDDHFIVGSSPEVLVRMEKGRVEVRPIAGTRPRGKDEKKDLLLEKDLRKDPKEIAEHIMLVDLGRNDVGRIARMGTVTVDELMVVERYSHVMHLVSHVSGLLKPGKDAYDVFRAAFPAGTVSGAPKIRAMEIIEELEKHQRGPYAGAVGYFGFSGSMDFCITIRTMLIKNKKIYVQAGAGIVADSRPEREYQETVNKAQAMFKAIQRAHEGIENAFNG
jgi:anthranilate synthase component I